MGLPARWTSRTCLGMALALAGTAGASCVRSTTPSGTQVPTDFDDHTRATVSTLGEFEALSAEARGIRELKFLVLDVTDDERRSLRFLDGQFYRFHDEWYWLHLLSGHSPPGDTVVSQRDYGFSTPEEAAAWAMGRVDSGQELPLDLRLVEGTRLYADRFYDMALHHKQQRYGLGSVFRLTQGSEHVWAFKLEYADDVDAAELEMYFRLLESALPPEIGSQLVFVARSPQHHEAIGALKEKGHRLSSRLKRYSELVLPGQVEVYNPGLTAGRLRIVPFTETIPVVDTSHDILVLAALPDELPQAAGLITAVPQTPLAHVNLLAQNRGIPNLHIGGAIDDVQLQQFAWDEMPVVLEAREGGFSLRPLDRQTYALWRKLTTPSPQTFEEPNAKALPYVSPLTPSDLPRSAAFRREFGGKAAGYAMLLEGKATTPGDALAISVRPFHEHLAKLERWVRPTLNHPRFQNSEHLRYLILEGEEKFKERFSEGGDGLERASVQKSLPAPMRELLRRGGLRRAIVDLPLDPKTRALLVQKLEQHFSHLSPSQGLRFRSSSNVEDLEGFNGAGLYTSSTGYLHAAQLADPKDRARTVEAALKRTWASFYSFEAFEERRAAGISPFSGGMGVLVHPRFDDERELANGVFTLTIDGTSREARERPRITLTVNTQAGAESVTNALSGVTPEVLVMTTTDPSPPTWEIISASSRSPSSGPILPESVLRALFLEATQVGERWLARDNEGRPADKRRRSITLDFEFRYMAPEWPAPASAQSPARGSPRLILKQVRSLEPAPPPRHAQLAEVALPPELFARAAKLERRRCQTKTRKAEVLLLWTRPQTSPDFGYDKAPFVAGLRLDSVAPGRHTGASDLALGPEDLLQVLDPATTRDTWHAHFSRPSSQDIEHVAFTEKSLALHFRGGHIETEEASCQTEVLLDHPERLLREALEKVD